MIRFVAMTPELFGLLAVTPEYADNSILAHTEAYASMCAAPNVALAMLDGGRMMAAAGVVQIWTGRAVAWMLPGIWMEKRHFGRALVRCRAELARLHQAGTWRIECSVKADVPARAAWAMRLGFAAECRMVGFAPDGADHFLFTHIDGEWRSPSHANRGA